MRLNAFALTRPERPVRHGVYREPGVEQAFEIYLRPPDVADRMAAMEEEGRLVDLFITGETHGAPAPFPIDGDFKPTRTFLRGIALISVCQCPPSPHQIYPSEELIAIAYCMPRGYTAMERQFGDDLLAWENERPNEPAAPISS